MKSEGTYVVVSCSIPRGPSPTSTRLTRRSWSVKATALTEEFTFDDFRALHADVVVPLGVVAEQRLEFFTAAAEVTAESGHVLISLVPPENEAGEPSNDTLSGGACGSRTTR